MNAYEMNITYCKITGSMTLIWDLKNWMKAGPAGEL